MAVFGRQALHGHALTPHQRLAARSAIDAIRLLEAQHDLVARPPLGDTSPQAEPGRPPRRAPRRTESELLEPPGDRFVVTERLPVEMTGGDGDRKSGTEDGGFDNSLQQFLGTVVRPRCILWR